MKHIYIIEDDVGILDGLTFLLEKTYRVTAISEARIALKKLRLKKPDLILLDLVMPDLNGAAFIEAFSKQAIKIPILVMTARTDVNVRINYPTVAGLIRKPFQIEEMVKKVEQAISNF